MNPFDETYLKIEGALSSEFLFRAYSILLKYGYFAIKMLKEEKNTKNEEKKNNIISQ